jgi:hypothetical protein
LRRVDQSRFLAGGQPLSPGGKLQERRALGGQIENGVAVGTRKTTRINQDRRRIPSLSMRLIQRLPGVYRGLPKLASGNIITLAVNSRMYGATCKRRQKTALLGATFGAFSNLPPTPSFYGFLEACNTLP